MMLAKDFLSFLSSRLLTFACAESCTGGLVAQQLTSLPGASEVFWGGLVTYSNEAKMKILNVPERTIAQWGSVSGQTALAMVEGMTRISKSNLCVSVTGIAGPSGGSEEKPVGTVWFGLALSALDLHASVAIQTRFHGNRVQIRTHAAAYARHLASNWYLAQGDLDSMQKLTDNERNSPVAGYLQLTPTFSLKIN